MQAMTNRGFGWKSQLSWVLLGAVLGSLCTGPVEKFENWMDERLYHGRELLEEGMRLRREAIAESTEDKHRAANELFRASMAAGKAEAFGQLAIAYGSGLGVKRDWQRCRALAVEAVRRDGGLVAIYLLDPDVCPEGK
jgi:hypothetical protein